MDLHEDEHASHHTGPIPLQFQLLFNWELVDVSSESASIYKNKTHMYPAFKVDLNKAPIYRLIHHDFERHYISAGQLFKACGLTLTEGFFLFELKLTEFEVDFLISHFPFCDIWVSVQQGRAMAQALGVEYELELLLGEELDDCYTSDNISRNEIMHNWIVPSIPNLQYSTRALLETTFDKVELLEPANRKIRTQISTRSISGVVMKDRTETGLVRWQVWAYEQFLQQQRKTEEEDDEGILPPILDRSGAVWDSLQGILFDLQTLGRNGEPSTTPRVLSDNMMVGNMPLKKEYLGHSLLLQQLYTAVMAEKIMNELNHVGSTIIKSNATLAVDQQQHKRQQPQKQLLSKASFIAEDATASPAESNSLIDGGVNTPQNNNSNMLFHDRMDLLEQELYRVKRRAKKKYEEFETAQDDLTAQLAELRAWKLHSDRARKSERVWMLMVMACVIFGVVSLRSLLFS